MLRPADELRLRTAAEALGDLVDRVVFVGGAVTCAYITDPAAPPIRATKDVDVIVDVRSRVGYYEIEARLRTLGFNQRPGQSHPQCRWFRGELILDVMPDDPGILGFSNRWYAAAFAAAELFELSGRTIQVVSPVYFLATKLDAFDGRGAGDYLASADLEDVVAVIDGRPSIVDEIDAGPPNVRAFLRERVRILLAHDAFVESLLGHTNGHEDRALVVEARLRRIASLVAGPPSA